MTITHIFFDLYGTLVDGTRLRPCYAVELGSIMAERYGGSPTAWAQANLRVVADWESYLADLDYGADDGVEQMWEAELRLTRALFRLTATPEPALAEVTALSRELAYEVRTRCDAFFDDARPLIEKLHAAGYVLGAATHSLTPQARGVLAGGGVLDYFTGPLLCPDVVGHYEKDAAFFLAAGLPAENCLVVDDQLQGILGAQAAGMQAVHLMRSGVGESPAEHVLRGDLVGLLTLLGL
jgi:FMN phosphatase YigB (HAD superfamily)